MGAATTPAVEAQRCSDAIAAAALEAWALLTPLIAGQPRMRMSRDRRTFPRRWEVPLTPAPPRVPAAVRLYGRDGTARCLAADFDVGRGGVQQVAADAAALADLVTDCGGRTVTDRSPSGGRHVYILLAEPVPFGEMRRVVGALAVLLPSLDATPMLNLAAGCIRPPGAGHKSGGVQQLVTPLPLAKAAAAAPNPPAVWARLLDALAPPLPPLDAGPLENCAALDEPAAAGSPRRLSARMTAVARTGVHRYLSGSEARQAVLTAAAAAGWQLRDVTRHLETGAWPGLASFYARYGQRHHRAALARDWRKATAFVGRERGVSRCHTSQPPSHRGRRSASRLSHLAGVDHQFVRAWRTAVQAVEAGRYGESRPGLSKRMLLRSLAMAAHLTGSRYVEFGCRSLSLSAGTDPSTVARHLRELATEDDPLIRLVEQQRGVRGDLYELVLPDAADRTALTRAWPAGPAYGLRPAFRELGVPAALSYEVLEHALLPQTRFAVAAAARLSPAAAAAALRILAAYGLAERTPAGWRRGVVSLRVVAEVLGVDEELQQLQNRYRAERARWRQQLADWGREARWLRSVGHRLPSRPADRAPPDPSAAGEPPRGDSRARR